MPQILQTTQMYQTLQQAGAAADMYPGECNQINITNFVYLQCPKGVKMDTLRAKRKEKKVVFFVLKGIAFLLPPPPEAVREHVRLSVHHPLQDHSGLWTPRPLMFPVRVLIPFFFLFFSLDSSFCITAHVGSSPWQEDVHEQSEQLNHFMLHETQVLIKKKKKSQGNKVINLKFSRLN